MDKIIILPSQDEIPFKCRICLESGSTLHSFDHYIVLPSDNREVQILDALCAVTSESVENLQNVNLPQQICEVCLTQLQQAFIFKNLFVTASVIWWEYLSEISKTVKDETVDLEQCKSLTENSNKNQTQVFNFDICSETDNFLVDDSSSIKKTVKVKAKNPKIHPCPFCSEQFSALDLKKHIKTHKYLKNYLNAPGLPKFKNKVKFYATPSEGLEPLLSRTDPILHKCIYCEKSITAAEFNGHIDQHLQQGNLKCDLCDRQFHDYRALRTHRVTHVKHFKYFCDKCDKGFLQKDNYSYHMMAHDNVYKYNCEFCNKSFFNPKHRTRHITSYHSEGFPKPRNFPFKCRVCLCRFESRSSLDLHNCKPITKKLPKKTKKTLCHLCGKDVYFLSSHMARHGPGGSLEEQKKIQPARPKKLCPNCGKYVTTTNWAYHMRGHKGEKSYKCDLCEKTFWRPQQLRDHKRVHTGEKPFTCSFCGLTFSRLYNMTVHERIHIGVKPHLCNVCGKAFFEKSYLRKHLKTHRGRTGTELVKPVNPKEEVKLQKKTIKRPYQNEENLKQDNIDFDYSYILFK